MLFGGRGGEAAIIALNELCLVILIRAGGWPSARYAHIALTRLQAIRVEWKQEVGGGPSAPPPALQQSHLTPQPGRAPSLPLPQQSLMHTPAGAQGRSQLHGGAASGGAYGPSPLTSLPVERSKSLTPHSNTGANTAYPHQQPHALPPPARQGSLGLFHEASATPGGPRLPAPGTSFPGFHHTHRAGGSGPNSTGAGVGGADPQRITWSGKLTKQLVEVCDLVCCTPVVGGGGGGGGGTPHAHPGGVVEPVSWPSKLEVRQRVAPNFVMTRWAGSAHALRSATYLHPANPQRDTTRLAEFVK